MYIAILGRQPALSVAELERLYGSDHVRWFSDTTALIDSPQFDFNHLGGSQKAGKVVGETRGDWRKVSLDIVKHYLQEWGSREGKITLGISAYGFPITARDVQRTGLILKSKLKAQSISVRLVPNNEPFLNTAASHHNRLGLSDNHVELLVIQSGTGKVIFAESVGAQNITAFAARDQARPKTDSFVGMLPPKLARIMINLTGISSGKILDPFCGTGVLLQEALLLGFDAYGTDLSEKMVHYSTENIKWLSQNHNLKSDVSIAPGDAMQYTWEQPIDAVVSEAYLGQPFSAPPSPAKLTEVRNNCNHIISRFLLNIASQVTQGTPFCIAVPAWRTADGTFTHLPLVNDLEKLGYTRLHLVHADEHELLYHRENQIVARELLLLSRC